MTTNVMSIDITNDDGNSGIEEVGVALGVGVAAGLVVGTAVGAVVGVAVGAVVEIGVGFGVGVGEAVGVGVGVGIGVGVGKGVVCEERICPEMLPEGASASTKLIFDFTWFAVTEMPVCCCET
jgi:hypothetical protein